MPFIESKFSAQFAGLILGNLQTILQRDTEAALRAISEDLPVFAEFGFPVFFALNFPCLWIDPVGSKIEQSADDSYLDQSHEFAISFSVVDPDPVVVKTKLLQYARAIDQVIRTMSGAELTGGVTTKIGPPAWEITEHNYGMTLEKDSIYRRNAQLILTVQILER